MEVINENLTKLVTACLGLFSIVLTVWYGRSKEKNLDDSIRESSRQSVPDLMRALAESGAPMPNLYRDPRTDKLEEIIKQGERLERFFTLAMDEHRRTREQLHSVLDSTRDVKELVKDTVEECHNKVREELERVLAKPPNRR